MRTLQHEEAINVAGGFILVQGPYIVDELPGGGYYGFATEEGVRASGGNMRAFAIGLAVNAAWGAITTVTSFVWGVVVGIATNAENNQQTGTQFTVYAPGYGPTSGTPGSPDFVGPPAP